MSATTKNIELYGKLLLPKKDIFWLTAKRRKEQNICYQNKCIYCTKKRRCSILKKTYPKEDCPFCKIIKREKDKYSNFCDRKDCINCNRKRKTCRLLKFTDKRETCSFYKTDEQLAQGQVLLVNRIKALSKKHNGLAVISSLLKAHPEISHIEDDEILDIIIKVRKYERRYHFEYKNPKVFSIPQKWE